jgi:steroid 5-alpha reductase family enzyme
MDTYKFLPTISSHQDAASFYHSVLPFYDPTIKYISESMNPLDIYSTTNPFILGLLISIISSLSVFIISSITGNLSWYSSISRNSRIIQRVDRLWSILPVLYAFHYLTFASLHGLVSPRLLIVTGLQLFWGIRLTFNYWRKGGYQRYFSHIFSCVNY